MSHPLAFANRSLYHGRILIAGWRGVLVSGGECEHQVAQAFAPVIREHLLDTYGWLMLAACRVRQLPQRPPHSVIELPSLPPGLVKPAEIEAFAELERDGWIASLKALPIDRPPPRGDQLASDAGALSVAQFERWSAELVALVAHISDVIDES